MKRSPLPPRRSRLARGGPIKAKPRPKADTLRIYGPEAKRAWMKAQPCLICGRTPSDAAHLKNGGLSRKGDTEETVPLCADVVPVGYSGHHTEYDGGKRSFCAKYGVTRDELAAEALATHARFLAYAAAWEARCGG